MGTTRDKAVAGALMLIAGGVIGAGLALLYAPQSGKRTRRDIGRFSNRVKNQTSELVEDFTESVHDLVDTIGDKASELLDQGKGLALSAKKEVMKTIDEGQAILEKEKSKFAKMF